MAITGRGQPIYLVSQDKCIRLWHQRLGYASNAQVVRVSKLTNRINLDTSNSKYDSAKIHSNSNDLDISDSDSDSKTPTTNNPTPSYTTPVIAACQDNNVDNLDNLDKLCTPSVRSKSTRVVRQNKSMTPITSKLKEVHTNLWGPHDFLSHSKNIYSAILMCKHT